MVIMEENQENQIKYCKRCHRKLKDEKSKELGFGKICYKKYIQANQKKNYLFEVAYEGNKENLL